MEPRTKKVNVDIQNDHLVVHFLTADGKIFTSIHADIAMAFEIVIEICNGIARLTNSITSKAIETVKQNRAPNRQ